MRDHSNESLAHHSKDPHAADRTPSDGLRPSRLNRQDAARLLTHMGLPIAAATLAKRAVQGAGPPYCLWNGRAIYDVEDLMTWAKQQLGPKLLNTAQRKVAP